MLTCGPRLSALAVALWLAPAALAQAPAIDRECPKPENDALELRTAKAGLYYNLVGRAIEETFNSKKPRQIPKLLATCGAGSTENVQRLASRETAFAIVQSDVAHAAWYGHPRLEMCPAQSTVATSSAPQPLVCDMTEPGCSRPAVITPLYVEAVHILVRPHLNLSSLSELQGRKVWAGGRGSGERFSAERILSAAGVPYCGSIQFVGEDLSELSALQQLGLMQIDAVFFTGPAPTHQLQDAMDEFPEIHFFALAYDLVQRLTQDGSYIEALIHGKPYGKTGATLTVGVEALLMAYEGEDRKVVNALASSIHQHSDALRSNLRELLETSRTTEHNAEIGYLTGHPAVMLDRLNHWRDFRHKSEILKQTQAAIQAGAESVHLSSEAQDALQSYMASEETYDSVARLPLLNLPTPDVLAPDFYSADNKVREYFNHPRSAAWIRQLSFVVGTCVLLLVGLFMWMRRKLHRILVRKPDVVLAAIATILIWVFGSYCLYHYEGLVNEDFSRLPKSFLTMLLYFIPLFERTALTPGGQQTIQLLKYVGLILVGGFLSPVIRRLLAADVWEPIVDWLQGRPIMQKDITGHVVIINWDHRGREIIRHLSTAQPIAKGMVVVVTPARVDFAEESCLEETLGVTGDATHAQCLEKARVPFARSVVILSSWKPHDPNDRRQAVDQDVADTKTIQTLRAIRELCIRHAPESRLTVTAELRSNRSRREAELAAGNEIAAEIICLDTLNNDVLVQAVFTPGIATLYSRLATISGSGNIDDAAVHYTTLPDDLIGKSFGEALSYFAQRREPGARSIPIAVCRDSEMLVNPSDARLGRLREGDILFLITERQLAKSKPAAA